MPTRVIRRTRDARKPKDEGRNERRLIATTNLMLENLHAPALKAFRHIAKHIAGHFRIKRGVHWRSQPVIDSVSPCKKYGIERKWRKKEGWDNEKNYFIPAVDQRA